MKAGFFGGDWEDYIQPVNDHFDNLISQIQSQGAHAELARMPAAGDDGGGAMISSTTSGTGNPPPPSAPDAAEMPEMDTSVAGFSDSMQPGDLALAAMTPPLAPGRGARPPVQPVVFHPATAGSESVTNPSLGPLPMSMANNASGSGTTTNVNATTPANPPLAERSFLGTSEGFKPQVYLPGPLKNPAPANGGDPGAHVGITVATGVDLGAHSVADLKRWGVSDAGIQQLSPMLGLKGDAARKFYNDLADAPPTVSDTDAKAMDQGAFDDTVSQIQQSFDATNPVTKFADLPQDVRTAIVDLAYQYGTNLAARTPNFWKDVTSGDLGAAVGELRNFHDAYPTRRNREADKIQLGIGGGAGTPPAMRVSPQPSRPPRPGPKIGVPLV